MEQSKKNADVCGIIWVENRLDSEQLVNKRRHGEFHSLRIRKIVAC